MSNFRAGQALSYVDERGVGEYDLVLSFTGGGALTALEDELGARKVAPLYGSVDPELYHRVVPNELYRSSWVWGAFKMPAAMFHELHQLWLERERRAEYFTFVNAWIAQAVPPESARANPTSMSARCTATAKLSDSSTTGVSARARTRPG